MAKVYARVWQTWTTDGRRPAAASEPPTPGGGGGGTAATARDPARPMPAQMRQQLQMRRIERRWSVQRLAEAVQCDAAVIAAFERGEDTLDADTLKRVKSSLLL